MEIVAESEINPTENETIKDQQTKNSVEAKDLKEEFVVPKKAKSFQTSRPLVIGRRAPNIFNQQTNNQANSALAKVESQATTASSSASASSNLGVNNVATTTSDRNANPLFDNPIINAGMSQPDLKKIQSSLQLTRNKQYRSALDILTPLANSRNADARYRLALMVMQGLGIKKRPKFAFNLAKLAAEQDHPHAKRLLGQFYLQGYGVIRNAVEASKWL